MNLAWQRSIVRLSRTTYSRLLFFYPRDLRRKFGSEMADVFEDSIREAVARGGTAGLAGVWRSAVWELISVAAPSHLASRAVMAGAISFLASSVVFLAILSTVH